MLAATTQGQTHAKSMSGAPEHPINPAVQVQEKVTAGERERERERDGQRKRGTYDDA